MTASSKRNRAIPTSPQTPPDFPPAADENQPLPAQFIPMVIESLFLLVSEPSDEGDDGYASDNGDDGDDDGNGNGDDGSGDDGDGDGGDGDGGDGDGGDG
ncbi:hypothetical protein BGX27_001647, partial [Mortierella sp. AM989]